MKRSSAPIETFIHTARGEKVIFAADLANVYGVPTKVLNQAVKRNQSRFPTDFCFQLTAARLDSHEKAIVELMRQFLTILNPPSKGETPDSSAKREIGFHVKDTNERKGIGSKRVR